MLHHQKHNKGYLRFVNQRKMVVAVADMEYELSVIVATLTKLITFGRPTYLDLFHPSNIFFRLIILPPIHI
jgi:hypothetical protein